MINMKMSLIYEIRKCPVAEKKPDVAVSDRRSAIDSSSFFAVPLPFLYWFFYSVGQVYTLY